ncbi:hypothetical protein P5641_04800 [Bacillus subtilis]|nr:hypothetical protein [Bacillus subtilis]WEY97153.1 hypothetical protein P5641_04800 [Bacillus subtilis]
MEIINVERREDLIGKTGEVIKEFKVIDASQTGNIVSIRVQDEDGEIYWTSLDESGITIL